MRLLISALLAVAIAGPASALSTSQGNADGGVTIRANVSNGAVLDPGDPITFQYQSTRDAAVIIFDIDTQGYVTLLSDEPLPVGARDAVRLPDEFVAEGEPGVEFVFAVAVPDADAIDREAFAAMRDETRRINGDPFIAANMIAAELVRDVSQHSVFLGYTYFYVSERVEYPCYLCGTCDGSAGSTECDGYRIVQNFDLGLSLAYPLARGYEMVETAAQTETVGDTAAESPVIPDEPTDVNFYPYGSEVYYADPVAVNAWYSWGWYDPFLWSYPYCYPYYYSPWSFSIGFGWGWGWGWGGYYCSGWYDPWYGCGYPSYPYYPSGGYPSTVSKYKSKYKDGSGASSLTASRSYASKRDGDLRVASKGMKSSTSSTATWRSKTRTEFSKGPYGSSSHRVKTSVSGATRGAWAKGARSGSSYKNVPVYRGQRSSKSQVFQPKSSAGRSVIDRSSGQKGTSKRSYAPSSRGSSPTRSKSYAPSQRSAPRPSSGGTRSAPRMGSYKGSHSAPAMRSGGGWSGGSRNMGGMRSGGMKGGRGR